MERLEVKDPATPKPSTAQDGVTWTAPSAPVRPAQQGNSAASATFEEQFLQGLPPINAPSPAASRAPSLVPQPQPHAAHSVCQPAPELTLGPAVNNAILPGQQSDDDADALQQQVPLPMLDCLPAQPLDIDWAAPCRRSSRVATESIMPGSLDLKMLPFQVAYHERSESTWSAYSVLSELRLDPDVPSAPTGQPGLEQQRQQLPLSPSLLASMQPPTPSAADAAAALQLSTALLHELELQAATGVLQQMLSAAGVASGTPRAAALQVMQGIAALARQRRDSSLSDDQNQPHSPLGMMSAWPAATPTATAALPTSLASTDAAGGRGSSSQLPAGLVRLGSGGGQQAVVA